MDALAKVGAVCCDCNEDASAFCASSLRIGEDSLFEFCFALETCWVWTILEANNKFRLLLAKDVLVSAGDQKDTYRTGLS